LENTRDILSPPSLIVAMPTLLEDLADRSIRC
jgi:hypothetical protein